MGRIPTQNVPMSDCHFCGRHTDSQWAVTSRIGDPPNARWRRHVLPICPRCNRELDKGGSNGRKLKATGEWWYAGHTVGGVLDSPAANGLRRRAEWDAEHEKGSDAAR
jgi:hypothetical protein